ncbi:MULTISPECIES: hypothetical protein [Bacillaceae]|uniref:hypothetical protein n=1 Tax=Bacillaceae TaxID=186817 RepID=UPI0004E17B5F|nr:MULTISPECIES: hypothetical protein [Bacillaceae]MCF2650945.1 hypothetical protein [Niallia circulans]REB74183.1 hypothetical protein CP883_09945 [Cutibacterium acnes]CAI9391669.1 hypothetical protein BACSP_03084 [Bacillus sp. T2.9-1]
MTVYRNSEKMKELRVSVKQKGWIDDDSEDLHLYRLPDGKYTVASGNHRIFLSHQIDIQKINAMVSLLIPESYIPENIKAKIKDYEDKEKTYQIEVEKIRESLEALGEIRKNVKDEFTYKNFCNLRDEMYNKRQYLLLKLAKFLNLVPHEATE